jgi:hypothetical protein
MQQQQQGRKEKHTFIFRCDSNNWWSKEAWHMNLAISFKWCMFHLQIFANMKIGQTSEATSHSSNTIVIADSRSKHRSLKCLDMDFPRCISVRNLRDLKASRHSKFCPELLAVTWNGRTHKRVPIRKVITEAVYSTPLLYAGVKFLEISIYIESAKIKDIL